MINTDKTAIIITKSEDALRSAILEGIQETKKLHEALHGVYIGSAVHNRSNQYGFLRQYETLIKRSDVEHPATCVRLLMKACLMSGQERTARAVVEAFGFPDARTVPPTQYPALFRGAASILLHLWSEGHVVLNPYFSPNLKMKELQRYESPTLQDIKGCVASKSKYRESERWDLNHHSKRLFWATSWTMWEEFDFSELACLHARWLHAKQEERLKRNDYPIPPIPFRILLQELSSGSLADRVNSKGAEGYKAALDSFLARLRPERLSRPKSAGSHGKQADERVVEWLTVPCSERQEEAIFTHLRSMREADVNETSWPGAISCRPLWEDLPVRTSGSIWVQLFDNYIKEWQQRYESDSKYRHLRSFSDYLFLYLNWFEFSTGAISFPGRPGDINRFEHIKRGAIQRQNIQPLCFTEFLEKRFDSNSAKAGALRATMDFFEWVVEEYSATAEQSQFFENGFTNPIRDKDIHYQGAKKRVHARVRLNNRHAYLFSEYLLGVEAFYTKVESDAFAKNKGDLPMWPIPVALDAEDYGFIPIVFDQGVPKPIERVPALYNRHQDAFCDGFSIPSNVPNLSALRLLCFMLETGLRGANIRWLDRKTYKSDSTGHFMCKRIVVNTDKSGDGFLLPVSDEAFGILTRQDTAVRDIIGDRDPVAQKYQGRKRSRFEDVHVLFYSSSSVPSDFRAASDNIYRTIFRAALATYGAWLESLTGEFVDLVKPETGYDMLDLLGGTRNNLTIRTSASHTPHSIRSTVISERISVLPLRLVGKLVGHRNAATTAYYYQVDEDYLYEVLNRTAAAPVAQFGFKKDEPRFIQTGSAASVVATALKQDRRNAEIVFGLTSSTFGAASDPRDMGLDLLRSANFSDLAFFDTNICPFSGRCPTDVIVEIGESGRCGLCRYAVKSIDQLPAIAAKMRFLEERCRRIGKQVQQVARSGSKEEAQRLSDRADLDAAEALGWHLAQTVLEKKLAALRAGQTDMSAYHVDSPEILRRRLAKVDLPDSDVARLLLRISEANAYPSMQDEEVRQIASRLKRRMRGLDEPLFESEVDPVGELCAYLSARMEVQGLTTGDVIQQLECHQDSIQIRVNTSPIRKIVYEE